jgi:hypothetical protein
MPVSPLCEVKDGAGSYVATLDGVDITPANVISIRLASTISVTDWYLQVLGTDELSTDPVLGSVNPLTHQVTTPSSVVTFTAVNALGRAFLFQSTVLGPGGPQVTTFALYLLTALGRRVGAAGETREGNSSFGWAVYVNPLIRNPGGAFPPGSTTSDALVWDGGSFNPRQLTEDDILPGFLISSFSGGLTVELGETVTTPAFTASYTTSPDVAPNSIVLTDTEATAPKDVTLTPTAFTSDGVFTKTSYGSTVTLTLTAQKGLVIKTAITSFLWTQKVYWGKSSSAGPYIAGFITGLSHNALATSRATTLSMTGGDAPGAGEKIYYAFRSAYGTPTFYIGGFEGGFELIAAAVPITNVNGVIENYDLWRSIQANLGSTTVTVT